MADIKKVKTLGPLPSQGLEVAEAPEIDPRMPYIIHEGEEQEVHPIEDYQMPDRGKIRMEPETLVPEVDLPIGPLPEEPREEPREEPSLPVEMAPDEPLPEPEPDPFPLPTSEPEIDIQIPNDPELNGPDWQDKFLTKPDFKPADKSPHVILPYQRFIPGERVETPTPVPMTAYDAPGETQRTPNSVSMRDALSEATVSAREAAPVEDKSLVESTGIRVDGVKMGDAASHKSETKGKAQERGNESWIADIVKQGRQSVEQSLEGLE